MVEVIRAAIKHPDKRTQKDIDVLVPLLSALQFFKKQGLNVQELGSIARKLLYKKLEPGEVVYKIEQEADYAYFIIKG